MADGETGDSPGPPAAAPAPSQSHRGRRFEIVFPAVMALVAALVGAGIGGVVAYQAAYVSGEATMRAQRESLEEQRRGELRQQRTEAYVAFLSKLDELYDVQSEAFGACRFPKERSRCGELNRRHQELALRLGRATDGIVAYGTGEQLRLATELQFLALRASVNLSKANYDAYEADQDGMSKTRVEFQRQMCLDVNPEPRQDCSQITPRPR